MKAKFTSVNDACVVLEYDHDHPVMGNRRMVRTFFFVRGCVHEENHRGDLHQVCDRLADSGKVLLVADRGSLLGTIRREYRAMVRAQRQGWTPAPREVRAWPDLGPSSGLQSCLQ